MSALLVAAEGQCDGRCYDATGPDCTCVCRGVNHGVGWERAAEQTPGLVAAAELPMIAMLALPLACGDVPRAQHVGNHADLRNVEAVQEPVARKVDTRAPYSHVEWAAIKTALPRERERRQKAGLTFDQVEQAGYLEEVVRGLRSAEAP